MAHTANEVLNQVLIDLDKSLLSYVAEAWPWLSNSEAAVQQTVNELSARRNENIQRLANLLIDREWPVDFGSYPTDYTDLHYVALDYLLTLVLQDQKKLTAGIEQARNAAAGDAEGRQLLETILADERITSSRLDELARARSPVKAA